ncbi:hypothetical protein TNCV_1275171 [Trichonephila clavipes]|nr:hypothetical protein TNCV_1275171 [Trichonephila clavipes]
MEESCLTLREAAKHVAISICSPLSMLSDHVLSGCEISSHSSVGGKKKTPSCSCTGPSGPRNGFLPLLAVFENEKDI